MSPKDSDSMSRTRARTKDLLVSTALVQLEKGVFPSITELAVAANVSRATAYRYFPTQASLISELVDASLGPVLDWEPSSTDAALRMSELIEFSYPQMVMHEGALRAALRVTLEQWADARADRNDEPRYVRGNRKKLVGRAVAPLKDTLSQRRLDRLTKALSLIYGTETMVVLMDIWGCKLEEVQSIAKWVSDVLVTASVAEQNASKKSGPTKPTSRSRAAAR